MIVVTGGAGFIGSAFVAHLNEEGQRDIVVADEFGTGHKWRNLAKRQITYALHKDELLSWLGTKTRPAAIQAIVHMGACSTTTEKDVDYLIRNNFNYSVELFQYAAREKIPFVYASSAATYGMGEHGYSDDPQLLSRLRPINPYGYSKHLFDQWVLKQRERPPFWAGLKFFNVYGPQEYHKGGQASVVFHAFPQVRDRGILKLFKSYKDGIGHGEQRRDFVWVKDVVQVISHFMRPNEAAKSGIYNVGSGEARSFADLGRAVFAAVGKPESKFEWIEMPEDLKAQYQYFTEANLGRLREEGGYTKPFTRLEEGVKEYVSRYLSHVDPFL
ncbi:MAG: ADP-glyceromanno-heptose 6-epimerase [Pseudomonadota bacterium]|jgi:ADP-L-glycero-D-manno-heptose 6-epimerase